MSGFKGGFYGDESLFSLSVAGMYLARISILAAKSGTSETGQSPFPLLGLSQSSTNVSTVLFLV
ncbi:MULTISPECIES: hypothetical protein [unclassified Mesotoga]|uniref:hypothetical protein n=1 Tax=unclassified Mesotoga TaxID=1184398 RepID=UPI0025F53007|nr:hypothetical protein [Mesotoga sp. UBA5557]